MRPFHLLILLLWSLPAMSAEPQWAVAVYGEFRSSGVGSALIAEAEAAAKTNGFEEISLHVFEQNMGAVRLYEMLGYQIRARHPVVAHERIRYGGDYLLMTRSL